MYFKLYDDLGSRVGAGRRLEGSIYSAQGLKESMIVSYGSSMIVNHLMLICYLYIFLVSHALICSNL